MSASRTKLIAVVFGAILVCIFGCISAARIAKRNSEGQAPIREIAITIDASQREELFAQLRKFADEHSFRILTRDVEVDIGPSGKGFFVEMFRDDIHIIAIGVPDVPITVSINFYDTDSTHPASKDIADELLSDLKGYLSELSTIIIIDQ